MAREGAYLGDSLAIQTHHDASQLLIAMLDVKVDLSSSSTLASKSQ